MNDLLNYSDNKNLKKKSLYSADVNDFNDFSPTYQNIDMFKRFLINENRTLLSAHHFSSIHDTEIMPEYIDIERQITKKLRDMRSFFDIKNTIFKAMQSENSYTLCLFRKGFQKLFFGPKGIVTKKSPDLRRYYKSFENDSELNAKIYAGSLDYYDFLCNVKNSFDERLNFSNKKRLEIGGNFSISNSNAEKLHAEYLEFDKKRKLKKLLNNKKNNNKISNNNIKNINFMKSNKNINSNIENNYNVQKNKQKKRINNLFLNYKENNVNKNVDGYENEKNRKISLISNINTYKKNKELTQTPVKKIRFENSSKQLFTIKGYNFKINNEPLNNSIKKKYQNKIKYNYSFVEKDMNVSKDSIDNPKKLCATNENFFRKNSNKFLRKYSENESNINNNKILNLIKCNRTEIKHYKTDYFINKTPECSKKLPKLIPKQLELYETIQNTSIKNTEKKEINEIKINDEGTPKFTITDNLLKDGEKNKKNNFSLQKIRLALRKKTNDPASSKKFYKTIYHKRRHKIKVENKKNGQKGLLSDNNLTKKNNKKSSNKPLKIYYHYDPKVKNDKTVTEFLKNIDKNRVREKPIEDSKTVREKFRKNIKTISYLRHSLAIVKGKYNIK